MSDDGMPPRVLFCDFGGVLTPPVTDAFAAAARAVGVPAPELRAAIDRVAASFGGRLLEPLELGLVSQQDWGRLVTEQLEPGRVPVLPLSRFGDYWNADRPVNRPLLERLHLLAGRGIHIAMLTNSIAEWEPHRDRMLGDDSGLFEIRLNSYELGVRKPDQRIFELAEQKTAAEADECLLIDDMAVNCAAARRRGWHVILHRDTADTLERLRDLYGPEPRPTTKPE
jgi:putative hydrolase of the HAD superfamily